MSLNLSTLKPAGEVKAASAKENQKNVNLLTQNKNARGRPAGSVKSVDKTMIGFRVTKTQSRQIKQLALDLDVSVNELLVRALEHYRQALRVR